MNKWLKSFLLLSQIGGGLLGIGIIGRVFLAGNLTPIAMIINSAFVIVFAFGILAGLALIKKPKLGLILSLIFQGIQIPIIITPSIGYILSSGAFLNVYWHGTGWGTKFAFLGSRYYFYLNSGEPWCAGANIVALVLFVFLIREIWLEAAVLKISKSELSKDFRPTSDDAAKQAQLSQPTESHRVPLRGAWRS